MNEIELAPDQCHAIEQASQWENDALVALGAAHRTMRAAERVLKQTKDRLDQCELAAQQAEHQRRNVTRTISLMLQLPPGEWSYDKANGKLVKKEGSDAQPT